MKTVFSIGKKAVQSDLGKEILKDATKTAVNTGMELASDALRGRDVTEHLDNNIMAGREAVAGTLDKYRKRRLDEQEYKAAKKPRKASSKKSKPEPKKPPPPAKKKKPPSVKTKAKTSAPKSRRKPARDIFSE